MGRREERFFALLRMTPKDDDIGEVFGLQMDAALFCIGSAFVIAFWKEVWHTKHVVEK